MAWRLQFELMLLTLVGVLVLGLVFAACSVGMEWKGMQRTLGTRGLSWRFSLDLNPSHTMQQPLLTCYSATPPSSVLLSHATDAASCCLSNYMVYAHLCAAELRNRRSQLLLARSHLLVKQTCKRLAQQVCGAARGCACLRVTACHE